MAIWVYECNGGSFTTIPRPSTQKRQQPNSLEALSGSDVTVSVCAPRRVQTCAWLNAETSHVKCFNPERVQTVPDSIGNRRTSRRACFQQFLQLAGVKNVKALDLARPSHHHYLRLPLSVNIGEIAGGLIRIVREIGQPESFGSGVVSKENGIDNDRCSDHSRNGATALPLRHSFHQFAGQFTSPTCRNQAFTRFDRPFVGQGVKSRFALATREPLQTVR